MIEVLLSNVIMIIFLMTFVFFVAQVLNDNSIIDVVWGLGFIFIAIYTMSIYGSMEYRQVLITLLTMIWGLRLAIHILVRKKGKGEDFRYRNWRKQWGKYFPIKSYFYIFALQGFLMLIIALPIILVNTGKGTPATWVDEAGLTVWCFGFVFEVMADWQLSRFKKDPKNKGKIMDKGLWKWSRHPNYFGEIVMWWGIFIIALSSPHGVYSLISPLLITNLIVFYSGIPLLEKRYKDNNDYKKYAKKTPVLVPKLTTK